MADAECFQFHPVVEFDLYRGYLYTGTGMTIWAEAAADTTSVTSRAARKVSVRMAPLGQRWKGGHPGVLLDCFFAPDCPQCQSGLADASG